MSPHADQFNDQEHEVVISFDEWGEVRFPRDTIDLPETDAATTQG